MTHQHLKMGFVCFFVFAFVWCKVCVFGVMSSFCFGSRKRESSSGVLWLQIIDSQGVIWCVFLITI